MNLDINKANLQYDYNIKTIAETKEDINQESSSKVNKIEIIKAIIIDDKYKNMTYEKSIIHDKELI